MENQLPLENIPDDDHLDSTDEGSHTPKLSMLVSIEYLAFFSFQTSVCHQQLSHSMC